MGLLGKLLFFIFLQITLSQGKTHVRLTNRLGSGSKLTIRCQSKDDDLGTHVLPPDGSFEWSFTPNFLVVNTLFFCRIQSSSKVLSFDAYVQERDEFKCKDRCFWDVLPDGPCLIKGGGGYDICYRWPKEIGAGIEQGKSKDMHIP